MKHSNVGKTCKQDGCERPAKAKGWCPCCYSREIKRAISDGRHVPKPRPLTDRRAKWYVCTVRNCGKPHASYGACATHYAAMTREQKGFRRCLTNDCGQIAILDGRCHECLGYPMPTSPPEDWQTKRAPMLRKKPKPAPKPKPVRSEADDWCVEVELEHDALDMALIENPALANEKPVSNKQVILPSIQKTTGECVECGAPTWADEDYCDRCYDGLQ